MSESSDAPDTIDPIVGSCLCGAVRWVARRPPTISMVCHCRSCRRSAGAPAVAWLTFAMHDLEIVRGVPAAFRSSPPVTRTFCAACGTPLTYVNAERPDEIDVTTASLDRPERFPPTYHAWRSDGIDWARFADDLPAYARSSTEG
ncbi:MAG TPA: GFA family protein [Candidatus Binatia bacterium]|jgi:hypothetical protein